METQILTSNLMFARDEPIASKNRPVRWFGALSAMKREIAEILARIDRELPVAEARADRLMRQYGL